MSPIPIYIHLNIKQALSANMRLSLVRGLCDNQVCSVVRWGPWQNKSFWAWHFVWFIMMASGPVMLSQPLSICMYVILISIQPPSCLKGELYLLYLLQGCVYCNLVMCWSDLTLIYNLYYLLEVCWPHGHEANGLDDWSKGVVQILYTDMHTIGEKPYGIHNYDR